MSAYVVEDQTINTLVAFFAHDRYHHVVETIRSEQGIDITTHEGKRQLAEAMHQTNVSAVSQRYDGDPDMIGGAFTYETTPRPDPFQGYTSLCCWLYQCSEGDVPDTSLLFATMQRVCNDIAHSLLSRLPEVEATKWG